jgi:hypothetical protein
MLAFKAKSSVLRQTLEVAIKRTVPWQAYGSNNGVYMAQLPAGHIFAPFSHLVAACLACLVLP